VRALLGHLLLILTAPPYDLAPVVYETCEHVLQVEQSRDAIAQRQHDHRVIHLQLRLLVQVVQDHLGLSLLAKLDHHTNAGAVTLVADVADVLQFFLLY